MRNVTLSRLPGASSIKLSSCRDTAVALKIRNLTLCRSPLNSNCCVTLRSACPGKGKFIPRN